MVYLGAEQSDLFILLLFAEDSSKGPPEVTHGYSSPLPGAPS